MAITPGWGSQWDTLSTAINSYFGGGIASQQYQDVVNMLNTGSYTQSEMDAILKQIPEFETTYNANGELINVAYRANATTTSSAGNIAQAINSNAANATSNTFSTVQTITKDATTGTATISDDVVKYSGGTATTTKAVAGSAIAALGAAAAGITFGKNFDKLMYDLGFNWLSWAGVDMESLNPEKWATITDGNNTIGEKLFNFLFVMDPQTGNPQPYMQEDALAYMGAYMSSIGVFDPAEYDVDYDPETIGYTLDNTGYPEPLPLYSLSSFNREEWRTNVHHYNQTYYVSSHSADVYMFSYFTGPTTFNVYAISSAPFQITGSGSLYPDAPTGSQSYDTNTYTATHYPASSNSPSFYAYQVAGGYTYYASRPSYNLERWDYVSGIGTPISGTSPNYPHMGDIAKIIYGNSHIDSKGIPGISNQPGATTFNPDNLDLTDIDAVKEALQDQYPELWEDRIETSTDGDNKIVYVPVGFPTGGTGDKPTTNGATQSDTEPKIQEQGDNATDELIKTIIKMIQEPKSNTGMDSDTDTPTTPVDPGSDTGTGSTPVIVLPTGSANALYSIYNPTQGELNSFGSWLWSNNFVDQLLKIFNDPMQAIIGLHKVFATPPVSGTGPIKVGYLSSGVNANLVSNQYTSVDCGSVNLKEYFRNTLDYTHTDIYLYLPFVGIVPLNVCDVMRSTISVKYKVDVLTGACLANVEVNRDMNAGGVLYTYSGNCAVQYPLSSGSYMGILSGALGIAASVAGTIATGGAALPLALSASAGALTGMRTNVEHSGSLGGNAGAMGIKKPYLIIRRPQPKIATGYETFVGSDNNVIVNVGGCTGYTRAHAVHLENIPATQDELTEIETWLKTGFII